MKYRDYYAVLGVPRDAGADAIKKAYRRLARKYHPDVSKEADAEQRFKEMKEAYEVLRDPEKRQAYDQFGENWQSGQEFSPPPGWDQGFSFGGSGGGNFSDFFESLFGRAGAGAARGRGAFRVRGEDVESRIRISLEDAYAGARKSLALATPDGKRRTLSVSIPKGVTAGQRIRLEGQGGAGAGGAPAGDILLQVEFAPHRLYAVDGRNVTLKLPIAPWEAALGRKVTVPTLGGPVDLTVPGGSTSGRRLRLKGRGLPGTPPGDQYVELAIAMPETLSDEAEALYRELERVQPFDPRASLT
ncbi:MAG: DnaJ C-terminal domain-containing protein [Pseudomonadota bacterium]